MNTFAIILMIFIYGNVLMILSKIVKDNFYKFIGSIIVLFSFVLIFINVLVNMGIIK